MRAGFFGALVEAIRSKRPAGDRGACDTLGKMATIVKASALNPAVVSQARGIILPASRTDRPGQIRLLRLWVADHTKWVPDPLGAEYLVSPEAMLGRVRAAGLAPGDCDDVAMLFASLARAVGIRTRLTAIAFHPNPAFRHVYGEAWDGSTWVPADTTRPAMSTAIPTRALSLEVR